MNVNFTAKFSKLLYWNAARTRRLFLSVAAKWIQVGHPAQKWYQLAFAFSKYYTEKSTPAAERTKKSFRINHALHLQDLLIKLSAGSKPPTVFDIPLKVRGSELLTKTRRNGLLICSVHLPLNLVAVRYLVEQGVVPDVIIAKQPPEDGYLTISGTTIRLPTIPPDASVLIKVRSILRKGGVVIALIDRHLHEGNFSPNILRLAEKIDAEVIFAFTELQGDGSIEASLFDFSTAISLDEDNITERMDAVRDYVKNIIY